MPDISKNEREMAAGRRPRCFKFTVLAEFILGQCFKSCKDKKGTDSSLCLYLSRTPESSFGPVTFSNQTG